MPWALPSCTWVPSERHVCRGHLPKSCWVSDPLLSCQLVSSPVSLATTGRCTCCPQPPSWGVTLKGALYLERRLFDCCPVCLSTSLELMLHSCLDKLSCARGPACRWATSGLLDVSRVPQPRGRW